MSAPPHASGASAPHRLASAATLGAILLIAASVRVWRLGWGLDEGMFFPDEKAIWGSYLFAFRSPSVGALFGHTLNYPPLYGYAVGVATGVVYALGALGPARDFPGAILVARGVSVAAGLGTVLIVWRLGRRWYGARAGAIAAALLAVTPFEVIQTHYANADVLLGTCSALTLLLALRLRERAGAGSAFLAGASAGLAFAAKYPGIAFAAATAWVVGEIAWERRSVRCALLLGAAAVAGFAVAVVLACPPCVFETSRLVREVRWLRYLSTSGWAPENGFIAPSLGWYARPYVYQLVASLPFALGWPLYAAAIAGIVVALRRRSVADRVLLIGLLAYFVVMGRTTLVYPRYLVPLFPGMALLAGRALAALPARRGLAIGCTAAVLAYSLASTVSHVERFSYAQQRRVAEWIAALPEARLPARAGLRVAVPDTLAGYYALDPPFAAAGIAPRRVKAGAWFAQPHDVFVLPEWLRISIERDRTSPALARDLAALDSGAAGYVEAARFTSRYLDQDLYAWLDPAFTGDLYVGEIGFRVYRRASRAIPVGEPGDARGATSARGSLTRR